MTVTTYIGLGSNLGDSRQILSEAIAKLKTIGEVKVSKLYQSPPMGPQDQPNYLNAVAQLKTELLPLDLLDHLQRFEQEAGRVRLRHWGERTLDLDLLIYGDEKIQNERLTVPHVGIMQRDFVVIPLLDLDADLHINDQPLKNLELLQQPTLTVLADESWA
ncbi:2-amino-4-hydroxy-6-hydroxymethyldihydropteridine diphosphokinase [Acinetobacter nosocomialis]|jgi:2-amino-4-hydroxy-6-hydroxymethyldihydropteridine diphosphokinase|uniref:2-amino-4-hydroxy-6-hydroxymethyldihydropteridine pyrophosphokinase n=1 Tax=Acinetobacter nosocomialis TaxID=106654 RepID=A0AB36M082_ACINO|nr:MULTISPECIES: 2-amino-4-hydroxy-6-hydroxymethyldihydropteridine diphosphokinase [Acinetobacter]KCY48021.1 2-amino-4-hydroxy-6-hydroxymethyldihydropteridine diphosphokinase [Acinetobacter baumannii 1571545]KCZ31582.1 2-amino-4-hydroxy-6-hydroxymethyldihydropteridine diphosphokinase [Acinetobacter baumannii 25977_9]MDQ9825045.1 2-amino-4-hydroxy-6-hydroxymethyldihydropteridine diphosphokinase [Acinetobacter sp. 163]SSQ42554.1 folK [Acinetobacter baumannii]AJB49379.1 2-amino-4-hydroxy-6-hydrox